MTTTPATEAAWQHAAERIRLQNIERLASETCDLLSGLPFMDDSERIVGCYDKLTAALAAGPQPADELAQEFAALKAESLKLRKALSGLIPWVGEASRGPSWATPEAKERNHQACNDAVERACACFPETFNSQDLDDETTRENTRLRQIILGEISRLEIEATAHEATDYGNRCREHAARLRGEMRDA